MQFELTKEFIEDIIVAIEKEDSSFLIGHLNSLHPADIAEVLDVVNLKEAQFLYKLLDEEVASDVLVEIDEDTREQFLASFSTEEIAESLENMQSDDAADVIQELSESQQEEVLDAIKDESQSSEISKLLNYDEDSAGGVMDLDFVAATWSWTVKKTLQKLRAQVDNVDQVYTIYVVDDNKRLMGTLSLKRFLYASDDTLIKDIFQHSQHNCPQCSSGPPAEF